MPPEAPPGYQGRHAGTEDVSTGEALPDPCLKRCGGDFWYKAVSEIQESSGGSRMES